MANTFTVKIDTDNDAFRPVGPEVARILREIAETLDSDGVIHYASYQTLRDINGNDVGRAGWKTADGGYVREERAR